MKKLKSAVSNRIKNPISSPIKENSLELDYTHNWNKKDLVISVIDKNTKKLYGTTKNMVIYTNNTSNIRVPIFTEYILRIENVSHAIDEFYTFEYGKINNRLVVKDDAIKIFCYDTMDITGYYFRSNGSFILMDTRNPLYEDANIIELHFRRWKYINVDNEKKVEDLNRDLYFKFRLCDAYLKILKN